MQLADSLLSGQSLHINVCFAVWFVGGHSAINQYSKVTWQQAFVCLGNSLSWNLTSRFKLHTTDNMAMAS